MLSLELGFPLDKAVSYAKLRNPLLINDLNMQYYIQDRYTFEELTIFFTSQTTVLHISTCVYTHVSASCMIICRREVYRILQEEGIDLPRYAVLNRDPDKPEGELELYVMYC